MRGVPSPSVIRRRPWSRAVAVVLAVITSVTTAVACTSHAGPTPDVTTADDVTANPTTTQRVEDISSRLSSAYLATIEIQTGAFERAERSGPPSVGSLITTGVFDRRTGDLAITRDPARRLDDGTIVAPSPDPSRVDIDRPSEVVTASGSLMFRGGIAHFVRGWRRQILGIDDPADAWFRVDTDAISVPSRTLGGLRPSIAMAGPTAVLYAPSILARYELVGTELVRGESVARYRAVIGMVELEAAARTVPPAALPQSLARAISSATTFSGRSYGPYFVTVDVWIDAASRVRRERYEIDGDKLAGALESTTSLPSGPLNDAVARRLFVATTSARVTVDLFDLGSAAPVPAVPGAIDATTAVQALDRAVGD